MQIGDDTSFQTPPNTRRAVEFRAAQLKQFDQELEQFSTYVKMYCKSASIECAQLNQKVERLLKHYDTKELRSAAPEFKNEPVLKHVKKLYDLRNSELFLDIWSWIADQVKTTGTIPKLQNGARSSPKNGGNSSDSSVGEKSKPAEIDTSGAGTGDSRADDGLLLSNGMVPPVGTMSFLLHDGVPSSPGKRGGTHGTGTGSEKLSGTLSRTTSIPKDYAHISTGEMGIEFEALSSDVQIYGLCRELPSNAAAHPEMSVKTVTLSLWETEGQKLMASCKTCVVRGRPESGTLIHQDRFLAGRFKEPVTLRRGKTYRISVGYGRGTNEQIMKSHLLN